MFSLAYITHHFYGLGKLSSHPLQIASSTTRQQFEHHDRETSSTRAMRPLPLKARLQIG